jgi:hypothetical protein
MSSCSVKVLGGVSVAGLVLFPTVPMTGFPVRTAAAKAGAGVALAAPLLVIALWRIAPAPVRDIPESRSTTMFAPVPLVLLVKVTVSVVEAVAKEFATKHQTEFAEEL